ncbi:MAG: hypothetical protein H0V88_15450 [Pyrinomonadaceae bacterium]|nr:hypothetical protein [Pyrinomonadaceae bacterium]
MSFNVEELPQEPGAPAAPCGSSLFKSNTETSTLAALPLGARLMLRCRADWRDATIISVAPDRITLSVNAPSGRTYRVRRPADAELWFDGAMPVLGDENKGTWRAGLARYDARW